MNAKVFRRKSDSHKGDHGQILIVGGSVGLSGAPVLAALGALRSGAGLVTLAVPESIYFVAAAHDPEIMVTPIPEGAGGCFGPLSVKPVLEWIKKVDVVAIGPGLSQGSATHLFLRQLLPYVNKPIVLDADALNWLAVDRAPLQKLPTDAVLTPHPGEMARLMKTSIEAVQRNREKIAKQAAASFNAVVVLKGHRTVVANPAGKIFVNTTGNPGMGAGGMGDVLTGMIAALIGQGLGLFDAAVLGVRLHGFSGDVAAREMGPVGILATDLADRIPKAIQKLLKST